MEKVVDDASDIDTRINSFKKKRLFFSLRQYPHWENLKGGRAAKLHSAQHEKIPRIYMKKTTCFLTCQFKINFEKNMNSQTSFYFSIRGHSHILGRAGKGGAQSWALYPSDTSRNSVHFHGSDAVDVLAQTLFTRSCRSAVVAWVHVCSGHIIFHWPSYRRV